MKKIFVVTLAIFLMFNMTMSTFATNTSILIDATYDTDRTDDQFARTVNNEENCLLTNSITDDYSDVKAFLAKQGMHQIFIDKLNESQLSRYASVIRKTETNTQLTPIIKGDNGAIILVAPFEPIIHDPGSPSGVYSRTHDDDNMFLYLLVTYLGNGRYLLSVDAITQSPPVGNKASLGICAQNVSVENSSRFGWIEYTYAENDESLYLEYDESSFCRVHDDSFDGSLMKIDYENLEDELPVYVVPPHTLLNYEAHYEFEVTLLDRSQEIEFDIMATHDLVLRGTSIDWTFSIGIDGIGFDISEYEVEYITRSTVEMCGVVVYTPD